jgi:hypothetical protein
MSISTSVSWSGRWMTMLSGEWLGPCQARSIRSPPISRVRLSWNVSSFGCGGGQCRVEIEDPSLELSVGALDPTRVGDASHLQRLEAGCPDEALGGRLRSIVVGGVEENDPGLVVCSGRELVGAESPERLDVVGAHGEQAGDHGAGRLSFRQRSDHLPVLVEADRVRGIDDDLVLEQAGLGGHQLLGLIEPDCEHDDVCARDRVFHRGSARIRAQLVCKRRCMCLVGGRQDDTLVARHEVPCERAPEVAGADDCGCQRDSFRAAVSWQASSLPRPGDRIPEIRSR